MVLTKDRSAAAFNRINIGISSMMTLVAKADLDFLYEAISDYRTSYEAHTIVYSLQMLLEETPVLFHGVVNGSVFTRENITLAGIIKLLTESLNTLLSGDSFPRYEIKEAPSRLLHAHQNECEHTLIGIAELLSNSSVNPIQEKQNKSIFIQQSTSYIDKLQDFYAMQEVHSCITGLESSLNTLFSLNINLKPIIEQYKSAGEFDYGGHLKKMRNDMDILHDNIDWLSERLSAYSENRTTMIKLSNEITEDTLSDIKIAMDHIIAVIDSDVIEPLLFQTSGLERDIPLVYMKTLDVMRSLAPYYDDMDVENKLRALMIWRHPKAILDSNDVLQFKYPASESWRTWALSVSLEEFVLSGSASKSVTSMVGEYSTVLTGELLRMRSELTSAKNDMNNTLMQVLADLKQVRMESLMEDDFVLWVFDVTWYTQTE